MSENNYPLLSGRISVLDLTPGL